MAAKKKTDLGLKILPQDMVKALEVLSAYVAERMALIVAEKIQDVQTGVKLMAAIQDFAEMVGKRAKAPAEALYNILRFTTIPQIMDNDDITTIGVDGVGRCRLQDDISCKVENKDGLNTWLVANQLEDIITETVNAQTLAAQMRARMKANAEKVKEAMEAGMKDPAEIQKLLLAMPPAEIVTITPVVRAQLTRE